MSSDNATENDPELQAITAIVGALKPLDDDGRERVLDYALRRLGLRAVDKRRKETELLPGEPVAARAEQPGSATIHDIRTLREQKEPKSAIEMAALVGYYLAHLSPEVDRRADITSADIRKYFHDANFPLPESPSMTLVHARNAGYFDVGATKGSYRLNPVGHNLVAHRLPAAASTGGRSTSRRSTSKRKTRRSASSVKGTKSRVGSGARKSG